MGADDKRKGYNSRGIAGAIRLGRPSGGPLAGPRGYHLQRRKSAFADAASDTVLKGSANCFWPVSASKIAAATCLKWYCFVRKVHARRDRAKQSLSPHHHEPDTIEHLVPRTMHKMVRPLVQEAK